VKNKFI